MELERLIDEVIYNEGADKTLIGSKWYVANPIKKSCFLCFKRWIKKIKACTRILTNKGFVVYYKEQE